MENTMIDLIIGLNLRKAMGKMSDIARDYSFGGWLRSYRLEKKIGLREMSRAINKDPSHYRKIEKSELDPPSTRADLEALCAPLALESNQFEFLLSLSFQHKIGKLKAKFK